jgi:hypothetical protein
MARQRRQRTEAEIQNEIQKLQAELTQRRASNQTSSVQAAQTQTAPAQPTKPRMVNLSLRISEAELEGLNYCTQQHRIKHPDLTETEARGNLLVQGVHTARPRMERQEQARLQKQQQPRPA